jgi:hypothetical protein
MEKSLTESDHKNLIKIENRINDFLKDEGAKNIDLCTYLKDLAVYDGQKDFIKSC